VTRSLVHGFAQIERHYSKLIMGLLRAAGTLPCMVIERPNASTGANRLDAADALHSSCFLIIGDANNEKLRSVPWGF